MTFDKISDTLNHDKKKVWRVLQWLEDHNVIGENENNEVEWLK
jgi:predicted transcriptional regulator